MNYRVTGAVPEVPLYIAINTACHMSGLSRSTIYRLATKRLISMKQVAGRTLVSMASLAAYLEAAPDFVPRSADALPGRDIAA